MIQFNLLPDIKLEYIRTRRTKRLIMLIASVVTAVSVTVMVLLFTVVNGFQKSHLNNLSSDIERTGTAIKDTEDLDKILTIQSQLTSLPALHEQKPVASRLFAYTSQVTPVNTSIARLNISFTDQTITITGAADTLGTINKFVDTLKFTEFKNGDVQERAFFDVVLSSFGRDGRGASYTINLKFKPTIFESASAVELVVPNIITTRSQTERPEEALFQPLTIPTAEGELPQ